MKTVKGIAALLLFAGAFTACSEDDKIEPEPIKATIEHIEAGLKPIAWHTRIELDGIAFTSAERMCCRQPRVTTTNHRHFKIKYMHIISIV